MNPVSALYHRYQEWRVERIYRNWIFREARAVFRRQRLTEEQHLLEEIAAVLEHDLMVKRIYNTLFTGSMKERIDQIIEEREYGNHTS